MDFMKRLGDKNGWCDLTYKNGEIFSQNQRFFTIQKLELNMKNGHFFRHGTWVGPRMGNRIEA